MKWWPFKNESVDERIQNTRNMIYKETFIIIVVLCHISIIVKLFYYGQNIDMIVTELVALTISSLYYGIRSIKLGLYSDQVEIHDRKSKFSMSNKNIFWGLGLGIVIAIFMGVRSSIIYSDGGIQSWWYFLIVFLACIMIYIPILVIFSTGSHHLSDWLSKKAANKDLDE